MIFFYIHGSEHRDSVDKIQQNATVCRYLFTANILYMFRFSIEPIIRSTWNCNCSLWYRSYYVTVQQNSSNVALLGHVGGRLLHCYYELYQRLQLQFYLLLMMGAMDTRNMYSDFAVNEKQPSYNVAIWPRWRKVVAQIPRPVSEAAIIVLCTPDDGYDGHPKHVQWFCSK